MPERSFGQVATVRIDNPWAVGPQFYGLVLTDRRSIFVHTFTDKSMIGGALGGAVGAVLAGSAQAKPRDPSSFAGLDPDILANEPKSIVVDHASVARWELKKQALDDVYNLLIEFTAAGKGRKLKAMITEVASVTEKPTWSGAKRKEVCRAYAQAVEAAYAQALSPELKTRFRGVG